MEAEAQKNPDKTIKGISGGRHFQIVPDIFRFDMTRFDLTNLLRHNGIEYFEAGGISESELQVNVLRSHFVFERERLRSFSVGAV